MLIKKKVWSQKMIQNVAGSFCMETCYFKNPSTHWSALHRTAILQCWCNLCLCELVCAFGLTREIISGLNITTSAKKPAHWLVGFCENCNPACSLLFLHFPSKFVRRHKKSRFVIWQRLIHWRRLLDATLSILSSKALSLVGLSGLSRTSVMQEHVRTWAQRHRVFIKTEPTETETLSRLASVGDQQQEHNNKTEQMSTDSLKFRVAST